MKKTTTIKKLKTRKFTGDNYIPFIKTGEFSSQGTVANPIDWKTGRTVHLLSQGELYTWYLFNFKEEVKEIREQFPLDPRITSKIAATCGLKHPYDKENKTPSVMTTDMLLLMTNGEKMAISVKNNKEKFLNNKSQLMNCYLEFLYWQSLDIPYKMVYKDKLNTIRAKNISLIVEYYNIDINETDSSKILKHLLANKIIETDLDKPLDIDYLLTKHKKELETWNQESK